MGRETQKGNKGKATGMCENNTSIILMIYLEQVSRQQTILGPLADIRSKNEPGNQRTRLSSRSVYNTRTKRSLSKIKTHCAILAESTAACKHPQTPACFTVFCEESDTPSHFSDTLLLWRAQSTALLQHE